jgi:8-oxo-dGTP pyrophosphatase MutT (NUDIX family)/phosphohistidine phosphatase SixA
MSSEIFAAGAVCWRRVDDEIMVLLIHRTKQKDVSFPKGKVDPGETLPQAAVREVEEETGLSVALGANLGRIHYRIAKDSQKTVEYWAAEVTEIAVRNSTFLPNDEVEALEWTPLKTAHKRLSYEQDRDILEVFKKFIEHNALETFSVIVLRHAKAEQRSLEFPEDCRRPLSEIGKAQAKNLVATLSAFGPSRIFSSTAERCLRTVTPVAKALNKSVRAKDDLSQDAWDDGDADIRSVIAKIVRKGKTAIVCSHRPVLPDIAREIVLVTGSIPGSYLDEASALPPGGFSVFHLSKTHPSAGILSIETYPMR